MSQYQQPTSISLFDLIWRYKFMLAFYSIGVSAFTFIGLYFLKAVPTELRVLNENNSAAAATTTGSQIPPSAAAKVELPIRVIIRKVGVNTAVTNPTSADNAVLNDHLLRGAVRYPGSGTLGKGNVFIFGHSTGLKVVNNQAFKAFNNLKNLNPGDEIIVQSSKKDFHYKVMSVSLADSNEALVDFSSDRNMLTLSTCNVFGEKQERFIVEAQFVSAKERSDL